MASANTQNNLSTNHRRSVLLDEQQNGVVLSQLGPRCLSLSTTLTVLSVSTPPDHTSGRIRCSGVLCLVKDYARRTFFIKIYDPEVKRLVWERNLVEVCSYSEVNSLYHLATLKIGQAGFHFTNESEAAHFAKLVQEKLSIRTQKQNSKESEKDDCENKENSLTANSLYPSLNALDLKLTETSFVLVRSALEEAKNSLLQNVYTAQKKDEVSLNSENSSIVRIPQRKAPPPPPLINLDEQTDDAKLISNHQNNFEEKCLLDISTTVDDQLTAPPTPPVRTTSKHIENGTEEESDLFQKDDHDDETKLTTEKDDIPPTPPPIDFDTTNSVKVFQSTTIEKQESVPTVLFENLICDKVDNAAEKNLQLTPIRKAPPVPAPRKCNKKMTDQQDVQECIYQNAMEVLAAPKTMVN